MGDVKLHDPSTALLVDYGFDWVDYLSTGEAIANSTWTANSTALSVVSMANTTRVTEVFVRGGTPGDVVKLNNRITTDSSPARKDDRTVVLRIRNR